jgi:hypothetical protein
VRHSRHPKAPALCRISNSPSSQSKLDDRKTCALLKHATFAQTIAQTSAIRSPGFRLQKLRLTGLTAEAVRSPKPPQQDQAQTLAAREEQALDSWFVWITEISLWFVNGYGG